MARTIESESPDYDDVELSIPPFVCQPWHNDACPKFDAIMDNIEEEQEP